MKLTSLDSTNDGVGDIERRLEEDRKLRKEMILVKNVQEKKNVSWGFDPKAFAWRNPCLPT